MRKFLLFLLVLFIGNAFISRANAITFDAKITADNYYALYIGEDSDVTFVGQNETNAAGIPGTYNWSMAESWNFTTEGGDYIYLAGWSDGRVAQGWIGQFLSTGNTLLSNTTDWQVFRTGIDKGDGSPAPTEAELETQLGIASWSSVDYSIAHGGGPWGTIAGISMDADWIWGAPLEGGSNRGEYQIFRTQVAPVPEPATMILLGSGLVGLAVIGRKKYLKK